MSRNGSGVYSLPAGSTLTPNTLADANVLNSINNDIATDLNTPRPIVAGGTGASTSASALAALGALPTVGGTMTGALDMGFNSLNNVSGLFISGYIYGLTLSNNTLDAVNDIDIAAGVAASDASPPVLIQLASSITKRLDAAWAVGTNQGGLDTGGIANTTYHVWLIQRSDTGVVDVLFSASATAPTMPTSYDRKRRIGSVLREAASIVLFKQTGNIFRRAVKTDRSSTAAFASQLFALSVPLGIPVFPMMVADIATGTASTDATFNIGSSWEGSATNTASRVFTTSLANTSNLSHAIIPAEFETNNSAQIYLSVVINSGALSAFVLATIGWIDNRGTV